jgi:hypothetical protein
MRPEVVRFLEADAALSFCRAAMERATAETRNATREFRQAWADLTSAEQVEVGEALRALNEPETVA